MKNEDKIDKLAKILWDYLLLNQKLQKADCILVLGGSDTRVAERGAKLLTDGWAPLMVVSGKSGDLTKRWDKTEAEIFAQVALDVGVPKEKILIENKSKNTGENLIFSRELLERNNIRPKKIILAHKPYMERRTYATAKKQWPEIECIVTSPQLSFSNYPIGNLPYDEFVNRMVGVIQRIQLYEEKGFQIHQDIPEKVWNAYQKLVELGFNKRLAK